MTKSIQKTWALILIPFPDAAIKPHKDQLAIQIRIASDENYFSLYSPLAMLADTRIADVYEHIMMRRNFYANQVNATG